MTPYESHATVPHVDEEIMNFSEGRGRLTIAIEN